MRWGDFRRSDNVEDRTGADSGGGFPVGGGMRLGGGALVVIVIASLIFGVNPLEMIGMMEGGVPTAPPETRAPSAPGYGPQHAPPPSPPRAADAPKDPAKDFVAAVLGDTEDVWQAVFKTMNARYEAPRLVAVSGGDAIGLRSRLGVERAVLLLGRSQALPRHRVLCRAFAPLRRARRFRPGLRDRA